MANPDCGTIAHHCGTTAAVRRDRNGRLYLSCGHCGLLKYNLPTGQAWILDNMRPLDAPPPPQPPKPEPAPAAAPAAPRVRRFVIPTMFDPQ